MMQLVRLALFLGQSFSAKERQNMVGNGQEKARTSKNK